MGRDDRRMARPHRRPAAAYAGRKAHRDLSGDVLERHVPELRRLRQAARSGDRLRGTRRLADGRKATAARDVPFGESWAFREHRTMAEVIAAEKAATA